MKEPRLSDLKVDTKGTRQIRNLVARARKIKITINVDQDSLAILRDRSARTGVPYQRLLNQVLRNALDKKDDDMESRLERLERELNRLKRRLVA